MKIIDFRCLDGALRQHSPMLRGLLRAALGSGLLASALSHADATPDSETNLKRLSLEELMNVSVTSVSKRPERLYDVPSAIQVITREDIRRAGATSLAEALRLASNLEVAQINSSQWAISTRGFDSTTSNKLLVLIDGRAVYTPLYAGVFWDVQDTMLEDVDRIEVISGPGAALWGTNAVNGVINVITMRSGETQGLLAAADAGTELRDAARLRWGGAVGSGFHYRVYGKYFDRDAEVLADGESSGDSWRMGQGGFRADWDASSADLVTIQGDGYDGRIGQPALNNVSVDGTNLISRWSHTFSSTSDVRFQFYFDRTHRSVPNEFAEGLNTYDWDFQHHLRWNDEHDILWGVGYRHIDDAVDNTASLAVLPPQVALDYYSAFVQDQIELIADTLQFTLGSKFEHNPYVGFEYEPSGRLAWRYREGRTLWVAISRAIRSPSRIDEDFYVPGTTPYLLQGGSGFTSEKLTAYEVGYRAQLSAKLALNASTYYNTYSDLRSIEQVAPPNPEPLVIGNGQQGDGYGAELAADYRITDAWHLHAGYNELHLNIDPKPGSTDNSRGSNEADDPKHQFSARSTFDLTSEWEVDGNMRYVSRLSAMQVPDYAETDLRIGWKPARIRGLQLSLQGQNLLHGRHAEFGAPTQRAEIRRSMYGGVLWHF